MIPLKERQIQRAFIRFINMHKHGMAVEYYNGAVFEPKGTIPGRPGMFKGHYRPKTSDRPNGFPDIIGVWYGRAFAIEVKRDDQKLDATHEQRVIHDLMRFKSWPVRVCRNFDELKAFLNSLLERKYFWGENNETHL